jgi:transcriptional regulator with XRE-family HTH domain
MVAFNILLIYYSQIVIIVKAYRLLLFNACNGDNKVSLMGAVMTDCRQLLARNMKKYRKILGLSQMALADKVGCSTTLIGNIEINRRFPSAGNINRIAKALEVKVADLFSEAEPESMKIMASKKELKTRFARLMDKAIDELFK